MKHSAETHSYIRTNAHLHIVGDAHKHTENVNIEKGSEFHQRLIISVLKQEIQAETERWRETGNDLHTFAGREI